MGSTLIRNKSVEVNIVNTVGEFSSLGKKKSNSKGVSWGERIGYVHADGRNAVER